VVAPGEEPHELGKSGSTPARKERAEEGVHRNGQKTVICGLDLEPHE
jgi:hypothetical protein